MWRALDDEGDRTGGPESSNIKFDATNRLVTIAWQHSKMDSEGRGISRTLQCICDEGCDLRCPCTVLGMLVNNATLKDAKDGHLAFREGGPGASKAEIVGDWRKLYGKEVTGHSTRRGCAQGRFSRSEQCAGGRHKEHRGHDGLLIEVSTATSALESTSSGTQEL